MGKRISRKDMNKKSKRTFQKWGYVKHRERKGKLEGGKRIKEERAQRVEEESEIGANGETKKKYWNVGAQEREHAGRSRY